MWDRAAAPAPPPVEEQRRGRATLANPPHRRATPLRSPLVDDPEQRHHVASDAPDHHARRVPGRMPALRDMDHARDPD